MGRLMAKIAIIFAPGFHGFCLWVGGPTRWSCPSYTSSHALSGHIWWL